MRFNFISDDLARRLVRMLKWFESHINNGQTIPKPQENFRSKEIRFIQIDGAHSLDTVLDCYLGTWNPATHDISYDTGTAYKCIDRRANAPTADDDAEGLAIPFGSDTYGTIWFILDLDCPA